MRLRRSLAVLLAVALAVTGTVALAPTTAGAIDADAAMVISEVYGGGGNTGAAYRNDFVELFNRSATPVDITGWSVQYTSANGTGSFGANSGLLTAVGGVVPPGGRVLVQLATGGANGTVNPAADFTGTTNMSATAGKVALVDQATSVGCNGGSTPCDPAQTAHIRDLVGYGTTANYFEGTSAAPAPANATAAIRASDGCADTNQNGADLVVGSPTPEGVAAADAPCGGNALPTVTAPATLTTGVGTAASAAISATDSDGTVVSLTVTSPASLPAGITFTSTGPDSGTLAVDETAAPGSTPVTFTAMDDDGAIGTATTTVVVDSGDPCGAAPTHEIAQVQGAGATSPLVGTPVRIEGIVSADFQAAGLVGGFYLQDDTPDADPLTSDGVLVFNSASPVATGDRVRVTGTVTEFRRASDALPGTVTELTSTSAVNVCGSGTVAAAPLDLPFSSAAAQEALEGVLVDVPAGLTATELYTWARFGEVSVSSGGRLYNPTNGQGGTAAGNDLRRIMLDDTRTAQNPASLAYLRTGRTIPRLGDTLAEPVTGVLTYEFDAYRVQPTETVVDTVLFTDTAGPRPAAPDAVGGDLRISTFNTLNYFTTIDTGADQGAPGTNDEPRGADTAAELTRQRDKLIPAIVGLDADVLGLMEIENSSAGALEDLVTRINDAQPGTLDDYVAVTEPDLGFSPNAYGGAFGTDLIKVGIIYRPAVVTAVGAAVSSADPVHNRPPLAQTFELVAEDSEPFTVVVNHFKSKGSCPAPGSDPTNDDLGQGCWNALRRQQAAAVLDLIDAESLPGAIVLGDLNSYAEEDPVLDIEAAGFTSVSQTFVPLADRYSYVFEGEAGELDHALVADDLAPRLTGADIWHINSNEPSGIDYNDFNLAQAIDGAPIYTADPFRSSDHDPLVFGLDLAAAAAPDAPLAVAAAPGWAATTVSWDEPASNGSPITGYTVTVSRLGSVVSTVVVDGSTTEVPVGPLGVDLTYDVEVVATNAIGDSPSAATTVTVGRKPVGAVANLSVSGVCAAGSITWTLTNANAQAVGFTWKLKGLGQRGSGVVGANQPATIVTGQNPGAPQQLNILVDGTRRLIGLTSCGEAERPRR